MKKLLILTALLVVSSLTLAMDGLSNQLSTAASAAITNAVNNAAKNVNAAIQSYIQSKITPTSTNLSNKALNPVPTPMQPSNAVEKPVVPAENTQTQTEDYLASLIKKALGQ